MMINTVILLLVLTLTRTHGRVAIKDEILKDPSENFIIKDKSSEIHIDLPTVTPTEIENVTEAITTTESVQSNTIPTGTTATNLNPVRVPEGDVKDNIIEPDESEIKLENMTKAVTTAKSVQSNTIPIGSSTESVNSVTSDDVKDNYNDYEENEVLPNPDCGVALKLTKYIEDNLLEEARIASRVDSDLFLGFESYTGFLTVNETYDSNMFFWYFPVEKKPVNETPWIIWLQGGPGASSMTGLFDEIGPFRVGRSPDKLERNPCSWLQNHSLLFIDNPVGTGYSYTNSEDGYVHDMDTYGAHLYLMLKQFLRIFPELRQAPLYIAGESYAGKYVPVLAMNIHRHKDEEHINLQGLITGNAYVDPAMISQMERPFYYFGLMEPEQIELVQPLIDAFKKDMAANDSIAAKSKWNRLITVLLLMSHQKHAYNFLRDDLAMGRYIPFLSQSKIMKAIHVGNIQFSWVNMTVNTHLNADFLSSTKWMYEELLDHYRVLTYCGQLDQMLSCVLTSENYRTWHWNASAEFIKAIRYPYIYNGRLAGYHKSGGHLTEVVIRGAGHMAPLDMPGPTQMLVARWTHGVSLGRLSLLEGNFINDYIRNSSLPNIVHYL